LSVGS